MKTAKEQAQKFMAFEMSQKIKDIILMYEGQIPLALAVGVLEVVKKELIEGNK